MTLTEFLLARIAEDEEIALGAVRWSEGCTNWADQGEPDWRHIARHDPAHVLSECEARRRIVETCTMPLAATKEAQLGWEAQGDTVLRLLADPYADHPDYREGWRA